MNGNDAYGPLILQELEKCLKTTCEEFIMSVTKLVVDPMLSFVTKVSFSFPLSSGELFSRFLKILEVLYKVNSVVLHRFIFKKL